MANQLAPGWGSLASTNTQPSTRRIARAATGRRGPARLWPTRMAEPEVAAAIASTSRGQ